MCDYLLKIVLPLLLCLSALSAGAQTTVAGQSYSTIISETCKKRTDGGCWIVTYQILQFENDSVLIYNQISGNCVPVDNSYNKDSINLKKYSWTQSANLVQIDDLENYSPLLIQGNTLIGKNENEGIIFTSH